MNLNRVVKKNPSNDRKESLVSVAYPSISSEDSSNDDKKHEICESTHSNVQIQKVTQPLDEQKVHKQHLPQQIPKDIGNQQHQITPRACLASKRVRHDTTHLIIGDSTTRTLKADLTFPGKNAESISVPGITINDVTHWLANIPASKQVREVVLHAGINSCQADAITKDKWCRCIHLLRRVFPSANIHICTLIPPKGDHPLKKLHFCLMITLSKHVKWRIVRSLIAQAFLQRIKGPQNKDFTKMESTPRLLVSLSLVHSFMIQFCPLMLICSKNILKRLIELSLKIVRNLC